MMSVFPRVALPIVPLKRAQKVPTAHTEQSFAEDIRWAFGQSMESGMGASLLLCALFYQFFFLLIF